MQLFHNVKYLCKDLEFPVLMMILSHFCAFTPLLKRQKLFIMKSDRELLEKRSSPHLESFWCFLFFKSVPDDVNYTLV